MAGADTKPTLRDERRDASLKVLKRVMQVLEDELGDRPRILKGLLQALAKIDPVFAATRKVSRR